MACVSEEGPFAKENSIGFDGLRLLTALKVNNEDSVVASQ
jgi:hypothetical protein